MNEPQKCYVKEEETKGHLLTNCTSPFIHQVQNKQMHADRDQWFPQAEWGRGLELQRFPPSDENT
jgi:hypothetical protein